MWRLISKSICLLAALGLATACARTTPAPVFYGGKTTASKPLAATKAPKAALRETRSAADQIAMGAYRVAADETLYAIARRSGVALRDLISTNNLAPPYRLRRGQHLQIPAVRYHKVVDGETLYGISRRYRVSPYSLARDNQVSPPYNIRAGQRLRLPASEPATTAKADPGAAPTPRQKPGVGRPAIKSPPRRGGSRFAWPVRGRVISRFGVKPNGLHNDGINIAVKEGTAVRAADNGVVVYAGNELRGFGNLLLLRHRGGWVTAYGHNQTLEVKVGDVVRRGQRIARAGSTGNIRQPQLHFEIRKGRRAVNPVRHLTMKQALVHFRD